MKLRQIHLFPPEWIPTPFTFENYPGVFDSVDFLGYFFNTLIIVVPSVIGTVISSSLAGYAFARLRHPFSNFIFASSL